MTDKCDNCAGQGWVCENHNAVPWDAGDPPCCGGAGMPCPVCNNGPTPRMMEGAVVLMLDEHGGCVGEFTPALKRIEK